MPRAPAPAAPPTPPTSLSSLTTGSAACKAGLRRPCQGRVGDGLGWEPVLSLLGQGMRQDPEVASCKVGAQAAQQQQPGGQRGERQRAGHGAAAGCRRTRRPVGVGGNAVGPSAWVAWGGGDACRGRWRAGAIWHGCTPTGPRRAATLRRRCGTGPRRTAPAGDPPASAPSLDLALRPD